jgi:hypothetical protein
MNNPLIIPLNPPLAKGDFNSAGDLPSTRKYVLIT